MSTPAIRIMFPDRAARPARTANRQIWPASPVIHATLAARAARICLYALLLCMCLALADTTTATAQDLTDKTNINLVRERYRKVSQTLPSVVNAKENEEAIRERLNCYEGYHEYSQRIKICNNAYIKKIVRVARQSVHSRPSLGEFVLNVGICPVLYNLCMGQTENDREECILFERQCIDYTLDVYWRGAAQYTQQTYRLDQ
ncbi:MAG: hypothetical protein ACK5JO_13265 [Halodesulfovibrio sp.]